MNEAMLSIERFALRAGFSAAAAIRHLLPRRVRGLFDYAFRLWLRQYPDWKPPRIEGRYANLLEVCRADALNAGEPAKLP
jgi:hypothetical protein